MIDKLLVWGLGFSVAVASCFAFASPDDDKKYSSFIGKALNGVSNEVLDKSCIRKKDFQTYRVPNYQKYFVIDVVPDTGELIELMDTMAAQYKYDFRFSRYRYEILDDYVRSGRPPAAAVILSAHDYLVKSHTGDLEEWGLTPEIETLYRNGDMQRLRKTCFDGIANEALVGRHILAIVTAEADNKTRSEREASAHQLINEMMSKDRSLVQFISDNSEYTYKLSTYSFSENMDLSSWNMFNFREKLLEFEVNGQEYNTLLHLDIANYWHVIGEDQTQGNKFAYYISPLIAVSDWGTYVEHVYTSRCSASDDLERQELCKLTKIKYESMKATCASIDTWPNCVNPYDKACTLEDGNYCNALDSLEPIELNHGCEATCENENKNDDKPDPKKDEDHNVNSSSAGSASLMLLALLSGLGRKRWLRS